MKLSWKRNKRTSHAIISIARLHPNRRIAWVASCLMTAAALGIFPAGSRHHALDVAPAAEGQNFGQRTIQGKVVDDTETAVSGATVFLKNTKTRDIKSFTTTPDGLFRFAQVGMVDDYEVWAERDKHKSPVKTVSSFDSRKQVEFDLKLK